MKDDLHKDKLEEFLRKSLEGHSEDPAGDLWSKIAANIDTPVADMPSAAPSRLTPRLRVLRSWWPAVAAAAVVTGLLVGQHLYFSGKIEKLNQALEQNASQLKELAQKRISEQQTLPIEEATEGQIAPQSVTTTEPELPSNGPQNTIQPDQPANQAGPIINPANQFSQEKKQVHGTDGTVPPTSIVNAQNVVKNAGNPVENTAQANETKQVQVAHPANAPVEEAVVAKQSDTPSTWGRKLTPITMPIPTAPSVASIIPASLQQDSRYMVGLQMMPMFTKAKAARVKKHEPDQGPFPPKDDKSFTTDDEKSIKSGMAGVVFETNLSPRLRFGTGFGYRSLDIETTHKICFEYGDGKPVHGPHDERDYAYELNTATGSVQMLVSASSTVSPSSLSDTTKVEASVKTSERLAFASVPFYANYSFGNGRLRVLAKAGLVLNFLLDSDFNLDRIERPADGKFQFDRRESRHGSPTQLQTITASYLAGIGLEYQLSKSLSLRAEPTVMGSLTSLHNNPHIESSEISAG
ncbi:MAG: hypothetical protein IPN76_12125 [Saprospiraceae bacterium]|nr:hypothetical protein [Saprospiraceae bacterium]